MTPKVISAYKKHGFKIDMGCPARLYSRLVDDKKKRTTSCCGGFPPTDAFMFSMIAQVIQPENVFVIGNSFGLSTFVLADVFPNSPIDVIDAEIEGMDTHLGSELTRNITSDTFSNVNLTVGYSPQDLDKAMPRDSYQFLFIDGLHTNEQMWLDYEGVLPKCGENCVIYFHDVASAQMFETWERVKKDCVSHGFEPFSFAFTQMGCTAVVRGYPELKEYFSNIASEFDGPYELGFKDEAFKWKNSKKRPYFWDLSFGHLERLVRRKIGRIFGRR